VIFKSNALMAADATAAKGLSAFLMALELILQPVLYKNTVIQQLEKCVIRLIRRIPLVWRLLIL